MQAPRRQIAGFDRIDAALAADEPVQLLLVRRDDDSPRVARLVASALERGVTLWRGSAADLMRMSRGAEPEAIIAMLGPTPSVSLEGLLERGGAVWLLHRAAYPSNVGFAIRTAEVAGAHGVIVDADFNHDQRSRVAHVSMGAHRVLPVLWERSEHVIERARAYGHRLIAVEDSGSQPPWQLDLTGPTLFIAGNERSGIPGDLLAQCHATTALPMAGFVPSYNLHAAIAAIAAERLRQQHLLQGNKSSKCCT